LALKHAINHKLFSGWEEKCLKLFHSSILHEENTFNVHINIKSLANHQLKKSMSSWGIKVDLLAKTLEGSEGGKGKRFQQIFSYMVSIQHNEPHKDDHNHNQDHHIQDWHMGIQDRYMGIHNNRYKLRLCQTSVELDHL